MVASEHTATVFDVVFVGGGLANVLAAWRLASERPGVRWLILESGSAAFGTRQSRTWSFHAGAPEAWHVYGKPGDGAWLAPLATAIWPSHDVAFPGNERRLGDVYCSIKSTDLARRLEPVFGDRLRVAQRVVEVRAGAVQLASGEVLRAGLVVDGTGFGPTVPYVCAYQKFVGMNLELAAPHGIHSPLLMDARVEQADGFRFFYLLPWSPTELLVEDTYFSETPALDAEARAVGIRAYVQRRGWRLAREGDREEGVLPLPFGGAPPPRWQSGVAYAGVKAGRFHPTTGYSLLEAARFADSLAACPTFDAGAADRLNAASEQAWHRADFYRRLNNMMFRAAAPAERWRILAAFYQRDAGLIGRFYRGDLTAADKVRLLTGKPPVPVVRGLRTFAERFTHGRSSLA